MSAQVIRHPRPGKRRSSKPVKLDPPEHIQGTARAEWLRAVHEMRAASTLGADCRAVLEVYVINYARWREAEEHIAKHGAMVPAPRTGVPMHNPMLAIGNKASETVTRLAAALGLTPEARRKVAKLAGEDADRDDWDGLLA